MNLKGKLLVVISLILFLINIYIINAYGFFEIRVIRIITILIFFVVFLFYKGYKEKWVFISFLCFLVSDILLIYYEDPVYNKIISIIAISGYLALIYHVLKKTRVAKIDIRSVFIYGFLIALNIYTLDKILNSITGALHDVFQKYLLYIYGTAIIITCVFAANYNYKYGIRKSMYFMFSVFGFGFADLCAVLAYYFHFNLLIYLHRLIYIYALFFIVTYILIKPDKVKNFWVEE
ncbi:hypothetical protein A8C32_06865 [Flavivirga aquatica]|uniref:YhhN-like protein n=1 Tax=Flavivirga aquatica TaxID=1849968 RepID=A0A1E5SIG2_9FLAO|nr:hypothetical protein [Flavivirga aquatica]OEJ98904.1 hypothetical protein A8C32_06865 [Flavivirga aquatica]